MAGNKVCHRCEVVKPTDAFHAHKRTADRLDTWCRDCRRDYMREYRARRRKTDPEYVESRRRQAREYRRKHGYHFTDDPVKRKARTAVANALREGKVLPPEACEDCGHDFSQFRREAHHEDYTKPLDVEWLCSLCHGKRHRKEEAA